MNQAELINAIAEDTGNSKSSIKEALDALGVMATATLKKGDEVTLPHLGKLVVKKRAARTGRNPQTGKEIKIKARTVPAFKAAKALKDAVA